MPGDEAAPTFFIIGAPRCGTTAMSRYLSEHRDICFSNPKEPHYFATDLPAMRYVTTESEYLTRCFGHCPDREFKAIGEGSVWYLFSDHAIANILRFDADARFIVMVRNPLEMVPSMHQKAFESLDEDVEDFSAAWNLQVSRRAGRNIPERCREPRLLQYSEIGRLGSQLERAFRQIPVDQRFVVVYDDFVRDPVGVYAAVLEFLGVPYDGRTDFPRINANKRVRSRRLLAMAWDPPAVLLRFSERLKRLLGIDKLSILPRLREMLVTEERRAPLPAETRDRLLEAFAGEIGILEHLLGRDLSHWKQVG